MKKSKNDETGIVHGHSGKRVGILRFFQTVCKKSTGMFWEKVDDDEPITCKKCLSVLPR